MWRFYHPGENPFWQHEWRKFDANGFAKTVWLMLGITVALCAGIGSFLIVALQNTLVTGTALWLLTLTGHVILRCVTERQMPYPSFADDAHKGTLDFLRLLPASGHKLVLARKLPAFAFRLYAMVLWLPLYAAAFAYLGLPISSSIIFGAIMGLVDLSSMPIFGLLLSFPNLQVVMFSLMVATLWSMGNLKRLERSGSLPESVIGWAVIGTLIMGFFVLIHISMAWFFQGALFFQELQPFYADRLPLLWGFGLLLLSSGLVRLDRIARWLEEPKGGWQYLFSFPLAITLLVLQGYLWGWLKQRKGWMPEDCFSACAAFTFAFGGLLRWLWLNWNWAEKTPPAKSPIASLPEAVACRLVTLLGPLLGCLFAKASLSQLDGGFVSLWLILSAVDVLSMAMSHSLALHSLARFGRRGLIGLLVLSVLPLAFLMLPIFSGLAALSPSVALLSQTPLWRLLLPSTASAGAVPFWAALLLPLMRSAALRFLLAYGLPLPSKVAEAARQSRLIAFLHRLGEFVFLVPALERWLLDRVENPVFRHVVQVTRWRYSWLPYLSAFLLGLLIPQLVWVMMVIFVPMFWFVSYQTVHNYLRKLHHTGELWQWLITPMSSRTIVNGLRWGGWWWQVRWMGLLFWNLIGNFISMTGVMFSALLFPFSGIIAGLLLTLAALLVFGAIPVAINDAFRFPQQALTARGRQWSRSVAFGKSLTAGLITCFGLGFCVCFFWLPFVLGLSTILTNLDPTVRALDNLRKAPMERLPPP